MNQQLRCIVAVLGIASAGMASASVTFFEEENFSGRQFTIDRPVADFERARFNDRARSAVVNSGRWEMCIDAGFSGSCQVLGPGRYPDLGGYGGRVSSVRPVSSEAMPERDGDRPMADRRGGARAILFEGPNLTGRSYPVRRGMMASLDESEFDDRASSLRVEGGYWIFCSDANFGGECRTFGPGEYARLPSGLDNRISSGRRISEYYPYTQAPNWRR